MTAVTDLDKVRGVVDALYARQRVVTLEDFVTRAGIEDWAQVALLSYALFASPADLARYPAFEEDGLEATSVKGGGKIWKVAGVTLSAAAERKLQLRAYGRAHERRYLVATKRGALGVGEFSLKGGVLRMPGGLTFKKEDFVSKPGIWEAFGEFLVGVDLEADLGLIRVAGDVRALANLPAGKEGDWQAELEALVVALKSKDPAAPLLAISTSAKSTLVKSAATSLSSLVLQSASFSQALEAVKDFTPEAAARTLQSIPSVRLPMQPPPQGKYASSARGGPVQAVPLSSVGDAAMVVLSDTRPTAGAIMTLSADPQVVVGDVFKRTGNAKGGASTYAAAVVSRTAAKNLKRLVELVGKKDPAGSSGKKRTADKQAEKGDETGDEMQEEGQSGSMLDDF